MIKKIIHCADLHIRNFQRLDEYAEQLNKFIEKCIYIAKDYERDEIRIVCSGDILHSKNNISPELISFVARFIRQLEEICNVIVIAGNHDLIVNNKSRLDAISAIFDAGDFKHTYFLDQSLGYQSGCVSDDNITWAVYSIYSDYMRPDIEKMKFEYPTNKVIGLYHGAIVGCTLNNGTVMENGTNGDTFEGCDVVMAGDIHKRQELKRGDVRIVYSGSMIQQTFGETVTQHGFALWDVETMTYEFIDLESDFNLYDFEINDYDDIDNDKEVLRNY